MAQSLAAIYIHLIFSTKNREPVLDAKWREELFRILGAAATRNDCPSIIVGGVEDHIHMLFRLSRTLTIADTVKVVKTTSSAWINQTRGLPQTFHWQAGYAMFSVSQSNVQAVREYIQKQPEHHRRQSFQDELREWLQKYEMEWDERYLWE